MNRIVCKLAKLLAKHKTVAYTLADRQWRFNPVFDNISTEYHKRDKLKYDVYMFHYTNGKINGTFDSSDCLLSDDSYMLDLDTFEVFENSSKSITIR